MSPSTVLPCDPPSITRLLHRAQDGDPTAGDSFWRLVHHDLRELAKGALRHERANHTLAPTALVHEAFLRLHASEPPRWQNRAHFFGAAARAMRRVLVDHARTNRRCKRAGRVGAVPLSGEEAAAAALSAVDVVSLDDALVRLGTLDARMVQVVELRFFAGLTLAEIGELLGVSAATVAADWKIARMWLHRELGERADAG